MSDHVQEPAPTGSYRSYLIGFIISVVLTVVPFWLVLGDSLIDLSEATDLSC